MKELYGGHANVRLENVALADREGTATFHVTRDYSVNDSLLDPVWNANAHDIEVLVQTVDGYCEREHIQSVDLLKIDTQGNDLNVLRGASRMLDARLISLYLVEVMFVPMYAGQPTLADFLAFAEEHNERAGHELSVCLWRVGPVDVPCSPHWKPLRRVGGVITSA